MDKSRTVEAPTKEFIENTYVDYLGAQIIIDEISSLNDKTPDAIEKLLILAQLHTD